MRLLLVCLVLFLLQVLVTACWKNAEVLSFQGYEVYYTPTVTRVEAAKLGQYLEKSNYFSSENIEHIRVHKQDLDYQINWIAGENFRFSGKKRATLELLEDSISLRVFDGRKVSIILSDDHFIARWPAGDAPGRVKKVSNHEIFAPTEVTDLEVDSLINFLTQHTQLLERDDDGYTMQFLRAGDKYTFRLAINRDALSHQLIESCRKLQTQLTQKLFPDKLVDVEITDMLFAPIEIIRDQPYSQKLERGDYVISFGSKISAPEASSLADFLTETGLLSPSVQEIGLSKRGGKFQIAYPAVGGIHSSGETNIARKVIEKVSSEVFLGQEVEIQLSDQEGQEFRIIGGQNHE